MTEAATEVVEDEKEGMFSCVIGRWADFNSYFERQNSETAFPTLQLRTGKSWPPSVMLSSCATNIPPFLTAASRTMIVPSANADWLYLVPKF